MTSCKACKTGKVQEFLSFGKLPMGNAFLRSDQIKGEPTFSLDLGFCISCKLVQQISPAPLSVIQSVYKNYAYVPFGNTLESHYAALGKTVAEELDLRKDSFALDIGSNDGILLKNIQRVRACKILGIEPAERISEMARQSGVPTITAFFTPEVASKVAKEYGKADVVTVTQVLQHIPDVMQFLEDAVGLLKPSGSIVIEGRYFGDTVAKTSFDTVYHEMLYFFTLESLESLLETVGMRVYRAEPVDIYGGSLRVYAKRKDALGGAPADGSYHKLLTIERRQNLDKLSAYQDFAKKVYILRDGLRKLVLDIKKSGNTIAGYGAPSTGTTLLAFCGIGKQQLEYIVDDNPLKQGLLTPGTHVSIVASSRLAKEPPDYLMIIAWRLASEIIPKVKPLMDGGKAIIPLPEPKVIDL
jgi:SAM-dependent methyltransferase